jgi:hypothetical protein
MNIQAEIKGIKLQLKVIKQILVGIFLFSIFSFFFLKGNYTKEITEARTSGVKEAEMYTDSSLNDFKIDIDTTVINGMEEIKQLIIERLK